MITTLENLQTLLKENVCELIIVRRRPRAGKSAARRMLCTLDQDILNSTNGRLSLNFKPAGQPLPYNAVSKNLLPVWDILMQDYRIISLDDCDLVKKIPADETFWDYFNTNIYPMTTDQKVGFMRA